MYSDTVSILKAFNKDYFRIIFCSAAMWDSVWCFFFFFYSNISLFLISPSNFFLLMIWNVRCLNGQHGSLMLIFGVENPGSLQQQCWFKRSIGVHVLWSGKRKHWASVVYTMHLESCRVATRGTDTPHGGTSTGIYSLAGPNDTGHECMRVGADH